VQEKEGGIIAKLLTFYSDMPAVFTKSGFI